MLWFAAVFVLLTLSGLLLQRVCAGPDGASLAEDAALSPLLGTALIGVLLVFFLVVLNRFVEPLILVIPAALTLVFLARGLIRKRGSGACAPAGPETPRGSGGLFIIGAAAVTALLLAVTFQEGAGADYLSIWAFKALLLTEHDSLRVPVFLEEEYLHHHKDYPLLFPGIQAMLYRLSGEVLDRSAKLLYPALLFTTSLYLFFHLRRHHGLAAGLAGGGLCLVTPGLCGDHPGVCSAYMDVPLGCFTLAAFVSGRTWLDTGRTGEGLKTGIFLTAMFLTKNEGMAAAPLAALLLFLAAMGKGAGKRARGLLLVVVPVLVVGGTWMAFRTALPAGDSDFTALFLSGSFFEKIGNLPDVALRFLLELLHFERWGFLWILAAATAPVWARGRDRMLGLFIVGVLLIHVAAVLVSPLEVRYQLATAAARLPSQLAPLAAACVGLGLSTGDSKETNTP